MKHAKKRKRLFAVTFYFEVMSFGLMNAPPNFQQMMDKIVGHLPFLRIYHDDVMNFSRTLEEQVGHVDKVLQMIVKHSSKI